MKTEADGARVRDPLRVTTRGWFGCSNASSMRKLLRVADPRSEDGSDL